MNVDLGICHRCGAQNSKYVESCYKCGAFLPWASALSAAKTKDSQSKPLEAEPTPPPPVPTPPVPTAADHAEIMAALSRELNGRGKRSFSISPLISKRVTRRVSIPIWGLVAGFFGSLAIGLFLNNRRAIAPIETPTPAAIPMSAAVAPSPTAAPDTSQTPTPALTPAPTVRDGPSFDQLFTGTTSGTKEQKDAYWKTVVKTKVSWRGDFVQLGASPNGPLTLRCKSGNNSALVTITLSTSPPQTLAPMQVDQSIPVEGVLESYGEQGYAVSEGKVIG